jgi:hypothetical protein
VPTFFEWGESLLTSLRPTLKTGDITVSFQGYSATFPATVIPTSREFADSNGMLLNWSGFEIQFTAADLVLNGKLMQPIAGMRISQAGLTRVLEVETPGQPRQHVEDMGLTGQQVAMFAKQVK